MALIIKDRVKEITTTTGTGDVSLGGASATFDAFQSVMSNGDTTFYAIVHTASGTDEWEVGVGTWNTGNTLTRTTVYAGSNGTSAVNFSSGNKDIFMTYPASKAAVAGEDVTFADITATDITATDITATGTVTLSGDPTSALQAATKEYVDTIAAAGIHYHTPVRVESPSALTATYDNGTSGVGATLTNSGTQAALVIDGVTLSTSDRVLVYNQTNAAHNGVYTVTDTGSASTNWVLTRATDADSYGASDPDAMGEGDAYFVKEGDTGAGELYVMNTAGTITFGTTDITFTVIAETAVYSAGTGLTLTGTTFSTNQDISTSASPTFAGGTYTGNVSWGDNDKAIFGAGSDLQLYHTGVDSYIYNDTGNLVISNAADDKDVVIQADNGSGGLTDYLRADASSGQLKLAYYGSTKLYTASSGIQVTGSLGVTTNITVGGTVDGRDIAADGTKLDGIETGATGDQTASEILTAIKTVDGAASGLDADLLDGQQGSYYLNTGTTFSGDVSGTYNNIVVANDSHTHDGRYYTETEADSRFVNVTGDTMSGTLTLASGGFADQLTVNRSDGAYYSVIKYTNTAGELGRMGFTDAGVLHYRVGTSGTNQNIFHDSYHPNADKWTTARTLSLSGDASGSVSWDGSANATLSVTVANDSHTHDGRYYTESEADSRFANVTGDTFTGNVSIDAGTSGDAILTIRSDTDNNAEGDHPSVKFLQDGDLVGYRIGIGASDGDVSVAEGGNGLTITNTTSNSFDSFFWSPNNGTNAYKVFHDNYHPNADKWTTARTLSLSGDASGSVSWDGSANATLSVTVANDSHTHDGRYYTETEADARFLRGNTSDTLSGDLTVTGSLTTEGPDGGAFVGTWAGGSSYAMFGTANMSGSEYALISNGTSTYISGGSGGSVTIRGGGNDSDPQIEVTNSAIHFRRVTTTGPDNVYVRFIDTSTEHGVIGTSYNDDLFIASTGKMGMRFGSDAVGFGNDTGTIVDNAYDLGYSTYQIRRGYFGTDVRAPVFYDSANTSYYVDPASTGTSINVRGVIQNPSVWINDGDNYNNYNENIRLFAPSGNGVAVIAFRASGTGGLPDSSILGFSDRHEVRWGTQWQTRVYNGYEEAYGSYRAPIFYDSNNTSYYVDPASKSYINEIHTGAPDGNTTAPRWDTSFYVMQSQHWYGHSNSQGMYLGESDNDVYVRGQMSIGGTAIQSGYALTMTGNVDMNAGDINYVSQLHFSDNVRFYDDGNDNYLNFKWGDTGAGGIRFLDGNTSTQGTVYGDGSGRFGLLDNDGSWAVRIQTSNNPLELRCNNNVEFYVYDSYTYSPGSSRAPIFYDSDNTSYYVNAASTTVLNNLTINGTVTGIDAGAKGGGSDAIFWENDQTVTTNYTITNGQNAMSAGPITVNANVTVTIGDGEAWTVV